MAKVVVGSKEWCAFPQLGIPAVKARVDSGAKTSSLHAFNIQTFVRDGQPWVNYEVHPVQNNRRITVRCESRIVDRRRVKSSSGVSERRYVIRTQVVIGAQRWEIELTLTNRDSMGHRMLLGREAMAGRLIVDPERSFCLGTVSDERIRKYYRTTRIESTGLRIALLATDRDLYSNRRLLEAGEGRGHEMLFLDIHRCYMKLEADNPEIHYRDGTVQRDFDAVLSRFPASAISYGCALARHFESLGVFCLNSAAAIAQSRDKLHALQLLLDKGIAIPITGAASSPQDGGELVDMVGGAPLVIRLLEGDLQRRRGVLAETRKASESVIRALGDLQASVLVQEYLSESGGTALRGFVIGGKVVAAIRRDTAPGQLPAGLQPDRRVATVRLSADEKRLAIHAARALQLDVAAVDMLRAERGPLLIKVAASPALHDIESGSGRDVAGMMIAMVEKKLGWRRDAAAGG